MRCCAFSEFYWGLDPSNDAMIDLYEVHRSGNQLRGFLSHVAAMVGATVKKPGPGSI